MKKITHRGFVVLFLVQFIFAQNALAVDNGTWSQNDWSNNQYLSSNLTANENGISLPETENWQKTDWNYRQVLSVANTENEQSDYPVKIIIPFQSGMNTDFSDLRFVSVDGENLSYWLQSFAESSEAVVWVNIPALENGINNINLYFGNADTVSESDGDATFLFFDDFSDANLDAAKWARTEPAGASSFQVVNGELEIGKVGAAAAWSRIISTQQTFSRANISMEWKYRWDSNNTSNDAIMMGWKDNSALVANAYYQNLVHAYYNDGAGTVSTVTAKVYEDAANRSPVATSFTQGTQYLARMRLKSAAGVFIEQSANDGGTWTSAYNSNYSAESNVHPAFTVHSGIHHVDDVIVRPWLENEPTTTFGETENRFVESGDLTSNIFDSGTYGSYWSTLGFTTTLSEDVEVKVRSGENADLSDATDFANCEVLETNVDLSESLCVHDGDRYIQYQVTLTRTENETPVFTEFSLPYVSTQVVAQTGINQVVVAGKSIQLNGAGSVGQNLSYLWAIFSGVGILSDEATAVPTYSTPSDAEEQNVDIDMTIRDAFGNTSTDAVTVHIERPVVAETISPDIVGKLNEQELEEKIVPQGNSSQVQLSLGDDAKFLFPLDNQEYSYDLGDHGTLVLGLPQRSSNTGGMYVFHDINEISGDVDLTSESGEFDLFLGRNQQAAFGQYVSVLDLGSDGTDEILVSSPHQGTRGTLDFYNANLDLVAVMVGDGVQAIASLGKADLTGDSSQDIIFGPDNARLNKNLNLMSATSSLAKNSVSQLLIYSGSRSFANVISPSGMPADARITSSSELTAFATADFNGDGKQDIAVANEGEVIGIFFGKFAANANLSIEDAPTVVLTQEPELLGSMLVAGDVNGDGFADLVIAAPDADSGKGAVYILFGQAELADTIDLAQAGNVMKVSGLKDGDAVGQDLMLADIDANGSQEIFTLTADNTTYLIDLSELVNLQDEAATPTDHSGSDNGNDTGASPDDQGGDDEEDGTGDLPAITTMGSSYAGCSFNPNNAELGNLSISAMALLVLGLLKIVRLQRVLKKE